eukprot:jgi/Chlat1/6899/Chrsp52S06578
MCRLMVYLGAPYLLADLVTKPNRSLTRQSYDAKERLTGHGYLNGDGFGIGWFPTESYAHLDPTPCVFVSTQPAWNNENLKRLANKIYAPVIFAHVRAAYPGIPVTEQNCQPFVCGRYCWMHNGGIGGFQKVQRKLLALLRDDVYEACPSFQSDSGIAFAIFLNQLESPMAEHTPDELREKMVATINIIQETCTAAGVGEELSLLNFVVSDGKTVVATRFSNLESSPPATLYYAFGSKFECADEERNEYRLSHSDRRASMGIVSSEPITDEPADWSPVPRNNMVVMSRHKGEFVDILIVPIGPSPELKKEISRCLGALAGTGVQQKDMQRVKTPDTTVTSTCAISCVPHHILTGDNKGVMAIVVAGDLVVTGSHDGQIRAYLAKTYECIHKVAAHTRSIFALATQGNRLYSSSTRLVKVWDLTTFQCLGTIEYSEGSVFALAIAQGLLSPRVSFNTPSSGEATTSASPGLHVPFRQVKRLTDLQKFGHCSCVYALALCGPYLCSGAGDTLVKVWHAVTGICVSTLYGHSGSVMALAAHCEDEHRLFSGSRDHTIRVWDMATLGCRTVLTGHKDDVLGLAIGGDTLYSASADKTIRCWNLHAYDCTRILSTDGSVFLALAATSDGVLSGSSDGMVRVWKVNACRSAVNASGSSMQSEFRPTTQLSSEATVTLMEKMLREFTSIKTVYNENDNTCKDQCWKGAKYLAKMLQDLGAQVKLVSAVEGLNPVLLGRLVVDPSKPTVTYHGHYDVEAANEDGWNSDPFSLQCIDGYYVGRGVADDKGSVLAILFGVRELLSAGALQVNVNFIFDGMHENRSLGFEDAVRANADWLAGTDLIITSSCRWHNDVRPCLTYGMRGMICLNVHIEGKSKPKDLHSGKDGGAFNEPLNDLVAILSNLVDKGMILIHGFHEGVRQLSPQEELFYEQLEFDTEAYRASTGLTALNGSSPKELLMSMWRQPSVSIVAIETSTNGWSLIPRSCVGKVCIRHVPDQDPNKVITAFTEHVRHEFAKRRSACNRLEVRVHHIAHWWLGDPYHEFYKAADEAIEAVWGVKPLYVREGGSLPVASFMETALEAPMVAIPIAQATCNHHMPNERLRRVNLLNGKDVHKQLLIRLGKMTIPPLSSLTVDTASAEATTIAQAATAPLAGSL